LYLFFTKINLCKNDANDAEKIIDKASHYNIYNQNCFQEEKMNRKVIILFLAILCILAFTLQGQEIPSSSTFHNGNLKEDNFGLIALRQNSYSLIKLNQYATNLQDYQAEMKYKEYSSMPEWSKCVTLHSAHEYLCYDNTDYDVSWQQFNSFNTLGVKSKFAGVEVCYNIMNFELDDDHSAQSYNLNKYGIGFGFPNSESLRLFGWLMQSDYRDLIPNLSFTSYKAELAKRVISDSQITELGVEYEYYEVPDIYNAQFSLYDSEYFPQYYRFSNPNTKLSAYLYASSLQNFYLEPCFLNGHSPYKSPLLLANRTAQSLLATFVMEDWDKDNGDLQNINFNAVLSFNFGKYLGLDGQYIYIVNKDNIVEETSKGAGVIADMRLSFISYNIFRIIGNLEYSYYDIDYLDVSENLNYGFYGILQLTNHLNGTIFYKINNVWNRAEDLYETDHSYDILGFTASIRL
jgi:hypothetical protein